MRDYYRGKGVIVTGGASGLGRAFALGMAEAGAAHVVVADLDAAQGEAVCRELEARGAAARFIACDVADADAVEALATAGRDWMGRIDLAFNNAGVASGGEFFDIPPGDWRWLLDINLLGVVNGCRSFGRIMAAQGGGHLVNTGSLAAFGAMPGMALYNVSKAGVVMLSETLRAELAPQRVRVSVICPSFVRTNLYQRTRVATPALQGITRMALEGNPVTPERIATSALRQIARNRLYVMPTWDARLVRHVRRFFPGTMIATTARLRPALQRRIERLAARRGY